MIKVSIPSNETKNGDFRFRHYVIDGWNIYVGKNELQNDELSCSFCRPWDTWMHVASHAGSHVVVQSEETRAPPPQEIVEKAASIAAWFSKARNSPFVKVHIAEARNVFKEKNAPPGEVRIRKYKVVRVKPADPLALFPAHDGR